MKELNINIPSSWDEITLEMFDSLTPSESNPYEKTVEILNVLTGLSKEEINKLPATFLESSGLLEKIKFLQQEPRKKMPQEIFKTPTTKYHVNVYPGKWTAAQYLDYNTTISNNVTKKMARLIACFTVPDGKKYGEDYDFERVVDDIYENMPVTLAMGYASFFQLQLTSFAKALSAYSDRKKKRLTRRQVNRLSKKVQKEVSTQSGTPSSL